MKDLEIGSIVVLDDEIEYVIMKKINYAQKIYVLLANYENPDDIVIRIEEKINDELFLTGLKDVFEFDDIIKQFDKSLNGD